MMRKLTNVSLLFSLLFCLSLTTACSQETKDGDKTPANEQPAADKVDPPKEAPKEVETPLPSDPGSIDASELSELMDEEPTLQILDVRTPEEVAEGTIEGAKVININDADFAERAAKELDKSKPVAVYCKAGGRSARAVKTLAEAGFKHTYNLVGGITQWVSEGNKTVK